MRDACAMLAIAVVVSSLVSGQTTAQTAHHVTYGPEPTSVGELTIPSTGAGPFPVAILLHGGCWIANRSGIADMRPMAAMLATHGDIVPNADHFDFIKPGTPAWTAVEAAVVRITR